MTTPTTFMRCQGGQPAGVTGQKAVGPTFLDALFHQRQARLKSNPRCGTLGVRAVRPFFEPELADIEPKDTDQRLAEYHRKLAHIEEIAA